MHRAIQKSTRRTERQGLAVGQDKAALHSDMVITEEAAILEQVHFIE